MKEFLFLVIGPVALVALIVFGVGLIVNAYNNNYIKHHQCPAGTQLVYSRDAGYICAILPTEIK